VDDGIHVRSLLVCTNVEHSLTWWNGHVDDATLLGTRVPPARVGGDVLVHVHDDNVPEGNLIVGFQDWFDDDLSGAGDARTDVAVEVHESLVIQDVRTVRDLLF
jgi:hypothetical protein